MFVLYSLDSASNTGLIFSYLSDLYQGQIITPSIPGSYTFSIFATDIADNTKIQTRSVKVEEKINWSIDAILTNDNINSYNPDIVKDSNDNMHIAFEESVNDNNEIFYNKLDSTGKIFLPGRGKIPCGQD